VLKRHLFFRLIDAISFFYNCKITKSANRVLCSLLRLSFHRSANISKSRNNRSALNACAVDNDDTAMTDNDNVEEHYDEFFFLFISFSPFFSLYFISFKKVGFYAKRRTFCLLLLFPCSPRFLYSISFASLLLVLLSVFPNHPFITLLIAHAHIRLQT